MSRKKVAVKGWAKLAQVMSLHPRFVFFETFKHVVQEGRRADLRTIWDALGDYPMGGEWELYGFPMLRKEGSELNPLARANLEHVLDRH